MQRQKFIVDAMLGRLARWLRILGYDTDYSKDYEDWKIIRIAEDSGRIIVTRDKGLCNKAKKRGLRCFYVRPDYDLVETLASLAKAFKLDLSVDFSVSRCPKDNGVLEEVSEGKWRCVKCGQLYWRGSHWKTINQILIRARAKIEVNGSSEDRRAGREEGKGSSRDSEKGDSGRVRARQA